MLRLSPPGCPYRRLGLRLYLQIPRDHPLYGLVSILRSSPFLWDRILYLSLHQTLERELVGQGSPLSTDAISFTFERERQKECACVCLCV